MYVHSALIRLNMVVNVFDIVYTIQFMRKLVKSKAAHRSMAR